MNPWIWLAIGLGLALLFAAAAFAAARRGRARISPADSAKIRKSWAAIESDPNPGHALIAADKLLSFALRCRGFSGSVAEQLKRAQPLFSDPNAIWAAHKLRNRVAHEVDFQPSASQSRAALAAFRRGLGELGLD